MPEQNEQSKRPNRLKQINNLLGKRPFNRIFWAVGLIGQIVLYALSFPKLVAISIGVRNPAFFLATADILVLLLWGVSLYFDEATDIPTGRRYLLIIICVFAALLAIRVNLYVW